MKRVRKESELGCGRWVAAGGTDLVVVIVDGDGQVGPPLAG